jgi:DtxR family Mn-dependent transcriptional regulator
MRYTKAEEDYLKYIYDHDLHAPKTVKIGDIAKFFSFTEQSVNQMVKQLEEKGLLTFIPYKYITLTLKGIDVALTLIRAHRLWETFLTQHLGYSWDEVHHVSETLEHQVDPTLINRLDSYLNQPQTCPHGNPIPSKDLKVTPTSFVSLHTLQVGHTLVIRQVNDEPTLLAYLSLNHLQLGSEITLTKHDPFNDLLILSSKRGTMTLSSKNAESIRGDLKQ